VDNETKQEFEALRVLISGVAANVATLTTNVAALQTDVTTLKTDVATLKTDVATLKTDVTALKADVAALTGEVAELRGEVGEIKRNFATKHELEALKVLMTSVFDSVIREVGELKEIVSRMSVRLDKIAAGSHYVARLVAWSEKQDKFQEDILRRVQVIERKLDIRPEAQ
jgi:chromosome segregation ATPase